MVIIVNIVELFNMLLLHLREVLSLSVIGRNDNKLYILLIRILLYSWNKYEYFCNSIY